MKYLFSCSIVILTVLFAGCSKDANLNSNITEDHSVDNELMHKNDECQSFFDEFDFKIIDDLSEEELIRMIEEFNKCIIRQLNHDIPTLQIPMSAHKEPEIFVLGAAHYLKTSPDNAWFWCLADVIGSYFSVTELFGSYHALLTEGATWNTVWPVVKNTLRRYGGWLAAAGVAYSFANNCL
jgi:hypothetical protein